MSNSSKETTPQEKVIKERINQTKKFLRAEVFNQSLRELWSEIKEDSKYDLL